MTENNIYDMEAYYLYSSGYSYRVGQIEKINEKSIRMLGNVKIQKEDFHKLYKLNEEELSMYRHELLKQLSNYDGRIESIYNILNRTKNVLTMSEFVTLDSKKLQLEIDKATEILEKNRMKAMEIQNKEYVFTRYGTDMKLHKED